ncbi:MAG TPA: hypothetical protein VFZ09_27110 [Archangium sp.]|uniref:hypothetical protein n=1 Tax=Archangium sp. TaxID=1872627 RepID=UPI002E350C1C|nr:hypothetical protein [Archangium sp.]HEX5749930.1 hypothetical protein [Archangium sp.]
MVTVVFPSGRKQVVRYQLDETHAHFTSTVLGTVLARNFGVEELAKRALQRNRRVELAGFRLGTDDRLEAWCSLPLATLSPTEARFAIRTLAYEAHMLAEELQREVSG